MHPYTTNDSTARRTASDWLNFCLRDATRIRMHIETASFAATAYNTDIGGGAEVQRYFHARPRVSERRGEQEPLPQRPAGVSSSGQNPLPANQKPSTRR
jgi:hypothetical protein